MCLGVWQLLIHICSKSFTSEVKLNIPSIWLGCMFCTSYSYSFSTDSACVNSGENIGNNLVGFRGERGFSIYWRLSNVSGDVIIGVIESCPLLHLYFIVLQCNEFVLFIFIMFVRIWCERHVCPYILLSECFCFGLLWSSVLEWHAVLGIK